MQIVLRNKASGGAVDDGFGKHLRVIKDSFGVEKCWYWDAEKSPLECSKDQSPCFIRSIRETSLVFSPEGGSLKSFQGQSVHLLEESGDSQEQWLAQVVDPSNSVFYVVNASNPSWVLAEQAGYLVLQEKGAGEEAQQWVIELLKGTTVPTEKFSKIKIDQKKGKTKTRKISHSSGDDSDEDEDEDDEEVSEAVVGCTEETGKVNDSSAEQSNSPPEENNSPEQSPPPPEPSSPPPEPSSSPPEQSYSPPESSYSPPEPSYSPPEQSYSAPSYESGSYSGGGDSGGGDYGGGSCDD